MSRSTKWSISAPAAPADATDFNHRDHRVHRDRRRTTRPAGNAGRNHCANLLEPNDLLEPTKVVRFEEIRAVFAASRRRVGCDQPKFFSVFSVTSVV